MSPLTELLQQRERLSASELLAQIREGLEPSPARSGAGAAIHQLLLDYFRLDEQAGASSFARAFKRHPQTAQALLRLGQDQGLTELCALMQSVMADQPRPSGAFRQALEEQAGHQPGTQAFLQGFAGVAFASADSEAEIELSLAWPALEDCLLDQLQPYAELIAFDWGPTLRAQRQREAAVQAALAGRSALQLLQELLQHPQPEVLAQPSEYDIKHEGAAPLQVAIAVRHLAPLEAMPPALAARPAAATQLLAVYLALNGAALFCTDAQDLWSAGFLLLPAQQWDEAAAEMLDWLLSVDFQDEPEALPSWVRSAIPFGKIPGDASYWLLPVEGPFAGQVLLSNEDVSAEQVRYASFDAFIATLCLQPEQVLGCGGYISYAAAGSAHSLYPVGYRNGAG